ncbi:hypothetical protein BGZ63DRAFT_475714 [Mariannaea sp. PMI_226]|nr:hypothetical protein BGZ63DRAFT_475714 [Mariannaea sp. PMI_226]
MILRNSGRTALRLAQLGRHNMRHPHQLQTCNWGPRHLAPGLRSSSQTAKENEKATHGNGKENNGSKSSSEPSLLYKMGESAATTFASIVVLALGFTAAGYLYHKSYKRIVLQKMTHAFEPGDPVLDLATIGKDIPRYSGSSTGEHWIVRNEQARVDAIVHGRDVGHYHLLVGDKGCGKSSMLIEAMRKINGDGVAMFEAHADLEIFRIRLGKALDYEYHEDYIGGYFSERGPRESTALLDIERALNKLEKVAMQKRRERGKPLVVIVNQMHLLRDDEDGRDLIELLQQRAEQWAAANLVTMVFNSDDYWVYERFKQLATRMEVMSVVDLPKAQAISALQRYRLRYFGEKSPPELLEAVYDRVGGRLSFLNRVAKSKDMLRTCDSIKEIEKQWFLNQCWILGMEMDDDVMDQQKWASGAMVLAKALVDKDQDSPTYDDVLGHLLPTYPFHIAQEIMTRCDFIRKLDSLNLFSITSNAAVRASSVPMHLAFKEICAEPRFEKHLEGTIQRISDIESLGRTRELVAKDLVLGGQYEIEKTLKGITEGRATSWDGCGGMNYGTGKASKWPDFRLASSLWFLARSQDGPEKPETDSSASLQPNKHADEQDKEPPSHERDEQPNGSHHVSQANMDPEERSIDGAEALDSLEHDGQVDDEPVEDEEDFGALEMFDSNATEAPFSSQMNTTFDHGSMAPEAVMDDMPPPSHKKSKRDKKERKNKESLPGESLASADDEPSHKSKRSKRKSAPSTEIPDSLPTTGPDDQDDGASNNLPTEVVAESAMSTKRKRKATDDAEGKRRKKKKYHDQAMEASQELGHDIPYHERAHSQASPSDALSESHEAQLEEDDAAPSANVNAMDVDSQPNAEQAENAFTDNDLGNDAHVNGSGVADDVGGRLEMESIAKEALGSSINGQGQSETDVYDVPGSPIKAANPPSSTSKRARPARAKKAKPTYYEEPPLSGNEADLADMPSPSAISPKKRNRTKKASNRRKSEANRALDAEFAQDDEDDGTGGRAKRNERMAGYVQGRFSDDELSRIAIAVEKYRSENGMTQFQVNALIHAPGGTTAGEENKAFWAELFSACPDRHRQKIINTTRKKFHNFVARGTWTPEQDAELRDLIEIHGTKWSKIAGIINRHPEDLRDRYRNYIVCGDAQRKDAWDEKEEGNLTQYVMEAMGAIDELRRIDPSRELLKKPYEELIDWQNVSERMLRTRSRLQCITKWKALNIKTHGRDKLASTQPDAPISFRLEKARRQIADMPDEERYRLVMAINGTSVSEDAKIPWQRLVDKQFRNSWHRLTQMLLWHRLKQTIPGWERKTVRDCATYLLDQYNQQGELPDVSDARFNDSQEMAFFGALPPPTITKGAAHQNGNNNFVSEEYVGNSDVEGDDGQQGDLSGMDMLQSGGVMDENIQPDLPVEPTVPEEAIQPDLPVEPVSPLPPAETPEPEPEPLEPAPPLATRSAKKGSGRGRAPRRSAPPKRPSKRAAAAAPSQDPIEDSDVPLTQQPSATAEDNSEIDEERFRKRKTPNKFRLATTAGAEPKSDDSESVMDDMEDLPARIAA